MLNVYLVPPQGNVNNLLYPSTGHLGVTPVIVNGTCATKSAEQSLSLNVRTISVILRCTEERLSGPFGVVAENVLWQNRQVIFEAEEGSVEMREWNGPFRLTIPSDVGGIVQSSQGFKEWRVIWRIEVLIEHDPVPLIGNRTSKIYSLGLYNHRLPSIPPPSPQSPITLGTDTALTHVTLTAPHLAAGPGDSLTISAIAVPTDPHTVVRKMTVYLERKLDLFDKRESSPDSGRSRITSMFRTNSSPRPYNRLAGSTSPGPELDLSGKSVITRLEEVSSEPIASTSGFRASMTVMLPNRSAKWDYGETLRTKFVAVTFGLRVKITLKSKRGGVKEFSCPPVPVVIVATSAMERAEAIKACHPRAGKRKERSRKSLYIQQGTTDITHPVVTGRRTKTRSQPSSPVSPVTVIGVATDVQSILLPSDHAPQPRPISFTFPSPAASQSSRQAVPPISALLNPITPPLIISPPPTASSDDDSILRRFHTTGRRISTTASEEEETQPSRSRQRLSLHGEDIGNEAEFERRPSLNNMDALGLGLPQIDDDGPKRRPLTAPAHYGTASFARFPPPPLSGHLSINSNAATTNPEFNIGSRPMTTSDSVFRRPMSSLGRPSTAGSSLQVVPENRFAFTVTSDETPNEKK